ncbi:MAG: hypothetical protein AB7P21_28905 [Lautropia sp.]
MSAAVLAPEAASQWGAVLAAAAVAAVLGWLGARVVVAVARRVGLQDVPNARSSHTVPTPRGGGVGIVVGAIGGTLAHALFGAAGGTFGMPAWLGIAAAGALAMVGLADDVADLSRRWRFVAQALAATAVLLAAATPMGPDAPGAMQAGNLLWPPSFTLVAGLVLLVGALWWINLFNFMDGIDGIAAMQAIFMLATGVAAAIAGGTGPLDVAEVYAIALLAATLGFAGPNWAPARVFMGDVGSLFLGVSILFVGMHGVTRGYATPWFWAIVAGMFVSDATATLLKRFLRGDAVTHAHRSHLYQRLARRWGSHARVTLVYLAVNVSWFLPLSLLALQFPAWGPGIAAMAWLPVMGVCWALGAGEPDDPPGTNNKAS